MSSFAKSCALAFLALASCRSQPPDPTAAPQSQRPAPSSPPPQASVVAVAAAPDADTGRAADAAAAAAVPAPTEPLAGAVYAKEALAAFRVAACGGDDGAIPAAIDKRIVDEHCGMLKAAFAEYRREWLEVAVPFIAKQRPAKLPTTVVYPFGGGDLVSALATFPDGVEFTTISLEVAGDIRGISKPDPKRVSRELVTLRDHLAKLFLKAHSRTVNLEVESRGAIPGEIAFTMAALAIHGFEPLTIRYFDFNTDGSLKWLTEADFAKPAKDKGHFANAEIRFVKPGDPTVRALRHVAYDLSDGNVRKNPGLMRHLDTKPKVAAMTKAASHLLWDDGNFSVIRDWLMTHTDWMISDTTGVPPRIAKKYGFTQDTFGQYEWPEPFGTVNNRDASDFKALFKGNAPLPFRYGYPDNRSHGHMVITRKASTP